jgi:hypothetical protein
MKHAIDGMICWDLPDDHPWEPTLRPLVTLLEAGGYEVVQVKEKFGEPRVYIETKDGAPVAPQALPDDLRAAYETAIAACPTIHYHRNEG